MTQNRTQRGGIGGHTLPNRGATDDYITPEAVIAALGGPRYFRLDPCACIPQPWPMACNSYTQREDGLAQLWDCPVFLNPPYGPETARWLARLSAPDCRDGIALIFARTETRMFFKYVWPIADAVFFFEGRLFFHEPSGKRCPHNSGGPSCLIAYGQRNVRAIEKSELAGRLVLLNNNV